jgi:hypothetical protein
MADGRDCQLWSKAENVEYVVITPAPVADRRAGTAVERPENRARDTIRFSEGTAKYRTSVYHERENHRGFIDRTGKLIIPWSLVRIQAGPIPKPTD